MNIIVCVKLVINKISNYDNNLSLLRKNSNLIINSNDLFAIEEALKLKDKYNGTITVLSMVPVEGAVKLKDLISMGADKIVSLSSRSFAGSDTSATAYTLSCGIKQINDYDIIITGQKASDGETGQTGPGIARYLNLPCLTNIVCIENITNDKEIYVHKFFENGIVKLKAKLPILLTVFSNINKPRLPSISGKIKASKTDITYLTENMMNINSNKIGLNGSPTKVIKTNSVFQKKLKEKKYYYFNANKEILNLILKDVISDKKK